MDECGSMQDYAAAGVVLSTGVDNLSSHISFPKSSSVLKPWREREKKNIYIYISSVLFHCSCRHNPVCPTDDVTFCRPFGLELKGEYLYTASSRSSKVSTTYCLI